MSTDEWVGTDNWLVQALQTAHAERAAALRRVAELERALKEVEWLPGPFYARDRTMVCPCCLQAECQGHAGDCLIGLALAGTRLRAEGGDDAE